LIRGDELGTIPFNILGILFFLSRAYYNFIFFLLIDVSDSKLEYSLSMKQFKQQMNES